MAELNVTESDSDQRQKQRRWTVVKKPQLAPIGQTFFDYKALKYFERKKIFNGPAIDELFAVVFAGGTRS